MNINKHIDVIYKETEQMKLKADIYYPQNKEKRPGIILIHGGAWFLGSKEMYSEWTPFLAVNGYITMAIEYRLSTEDTPSYPDVILDIQDAINFLVTNSEKYNLDCNNIVLIGDSAGAHLATYLTLENINNTFFSIAATIGVYGVYDLPAWQRYTKKVRENDPVGELIGINSPIERIKDASPQHKYNELEKPFDTKFFIIWGDNDEIVPASQSESFSLLLEQKGFDIQTLIIPNKGHFWFNIFEDLGGTLNDDPNPLVAKNIIQYLERKLAI